MAPKPVRSLAGGLLGLVPLPVLLGGAFRRNARFVERADRWSRDRTREHQLHALRQILELAYDDTRYYRRVFDDIGFEPGDFRDLDDLQRLPVIDKAILREHHLDMCTRPVTDASVDYTSTGGTSGVPLQFHIGRERSAIEYAYLTTSWGRIGYRPGMPLVVLRGRVVPMNRRGLRHEYDPALRHHYYSNFHMTDENMRAYVEHMRGIGDFFLHVYPSSVATLARFIRRSGARPPGNLRGIIAESEIVYPDQRRLAEEVFGCRYFSCYGHTEKLVLAAECEHTTDYHVWGTYGYCELLDDQQQPVTTPGERGEIVGTGFINTVTPFIRYRTGDLATYVGEACEACGREQTILREIRGHRTQEVLVAGDGSEISWTALNMHDETFSRVRQFQFVQERPGEAVLRVVPGEDFGEEDRRRITESLSRKLEGLVAFSLKPVDEIPVSPRGKAIYVDQRISGVGGASRGDA
ncbi:MAG: phenylacetate--CoA ligase family protein [Phycisphaerae bacterium]|nr:phenylacetate--CoA ligase family protein [Phycisphaerae bacterium]